MGVLCAITGLCIADKRSQHLANYQQIDDKSLIFEPDIVIVLLVALIIFTVTGRLLKSALSGQERVLGTPEEKANNQQQQKTLSL